jgi:cbb3-type cytochrome oxidase subunit 3
MAGNGHAGAMEMLVVLTFVLLAGVYSVVRPDNRDLDDRDRRGWWPGRK